MLLLLLLCSSYDNRFGFVSPFLKFLHMYGYMKKQTKIKVNYSVDKDTENRFSKLADKLAINKSALIEKFMAKWTEENKNRDEP